MILIVLIVFLLLLHFSGHTDSPFLPFAYFVLQFVRVSNYICSHSRVPQTSTSKLDVMFSHIYNPLLSQMSFPHQYSDASTSALNLNDDSSTHSVSLTHVSHESAVGGNLDSHSLSLQFLNSIGLPNVQSTIILVSLQSHNPLRYASYFFQGSSYQDSCQSSISNPFGYQVIRIVSRLYIS